VTARFKAEYGHTDGGVVNMITKSGTNDFSGGGYWLFRHDKLNSKTFVENETGADKAEFKQNVTGAYIGGPISQDKAFFFGNIDYTSRPQQVLTTTNGLIPEIDAQGQVPQDFKQTLFVGKFNANINDNNFMTGRYAYQDDSTVNVNLTSRDGIDHGGAGANTYHAFLLKNQTVIGGDKLNEVFWQFNTFENGIMSSAVGGDLEFKELLPGDSALGHNINHPQQTLQDKHQIVDNFSWRMDASGDHDLKAGLEYQSIKVGGQFSTGLPFASFTWGAEPDFNAGRPADDVTIFNGPLFFVGDSKNSIWSFYIQDDWQPTDQLTLNLGLRWDIETNDWTQSSDRDPNGFGPGRTFISSDPLFFGSQPTTDKNNIAPRLGLAYDVKGDGTWVVRGGWGIYYQQIFWNSPIRNAFREGPQLAIDFFAGDDVTFKHTQPFCEPGMPAPGCIPVPRQPLPNAAEFVGANFTGTIPDLETPKTQHFSIGASTLLAEGWGLDVDYLHTRSSDQIYRTRRALNSTVNGFDVTDFGQRARLNAQGAKQEYNGLLMSVRGRVENITTQIAYTYGRGKGHVPRQTSGLRVDDEAQFDRNFGFHEASRNHLFAASLFYQLPMDFQLGTVFKFQSGFHFTAIDPTQPDLDGDGSTSDEIANAGVRGEEIGDSFGQIDVRLSKTFQVGSLRPQVFFEVFNLFNTRNEKFDSVVNTVGNPDFGTALAVAGQGRQAQFSLRLDF